MQRFNPRWTALATLVIGFGFAASAFGSDPGCYSLCQETANDCRVQAPPGNTAHCNRQYRECIAGCDAQANLVQTSIGDMAFSPLQRTGGGCASSARLVKTLIGGDVVAISEPGDDSGT